MFRRRLDIQDQRHGGILHDHAQRVGLDGNLVPLRVDAADGSHDIPRLPGRILDRRIIAGTRGQFDSGGDLRPVHQGYPKTQERAVSGIFQFGRQLDIFARIQILRILGRKRQLQTVLRRRQRAPCHVRNRQAGIRVGRAVGDQRGTVHLGGPHLEHILQHNPFIHGK